MKKLIVILLSVFIIGCYDVVTEEELNEISIGMNIKDVRLNFNNKKEYSMYFEKNEYGEMLNLYFYYYNDLKIKRIIILNFKNSTLTRIQII